MRDIITLVAALVAVTVALVMAGKLMWGMPIRYAPRFLAVSFAVLSAAGFMYYWFLGLLLLVVAGVLVVSMDVVLKVVLRKNAEDAAKMKSRQL